MDTFVKLAQKGLQAYEQSNQSQGDGGGNVQDQRLQEGAAVPQLNHEDIISRANDHAGHTDHSSFFANALKHLSGHSSDEHTRPLDEAHVTNSHREAYENNNASSLDAAGIGSAAAMQALQTFIGKKGGGDGSAQLVSLAMNEASKLFDSSGGASSGGKQDAINGAAMTVMKMVVQSKLGSSGIIGGGNSGGLGGILTMANKFL